MPTPEAATGDPGAGSSSSGILGRARNNLGRVLARLARPGASRPPGNSRSGSPAAIGALVALVLGAAFGFAGLLLVTAFLLDPVIPPWLDTLPVEYRRLAGTIGRAGKSAWILYPTGIFLLACLFADWTRISGPARARWTRLQIAVFFVFISVAGSGLIVTTIKRIIGRARPVHFDTDGPMGFNPMAVDASYASFPSGHATTAGAFAMAMIMLVPEMRIPAIAFALGIGASRVFSYSHYPSDVLAGLAFGAIFSWLAAQWLAARGLGRLESPLRFHLRPRRPRPR